VDRQGHEQATPAPIRRYNLPRLSPGGDLVAVEIQDPDDAARSDVWVYDVLRNTLSRVTAEDRNRSPVWTLDGKRLIFASGRSPSQSGLVSAPADRSSPPSRVGGETESRLPGSVSRVGIVIGYNSNAPGPAWTLPLSASANEKPVPFLDSDSRKTAAVFSPDGHWIAYAADDSGRFEIYVTPYPGPGSRSQISTEGGRMPRWKNDGRELFFRSGDRTTFKMMAVHIELGASLHAGSPRLLFAGDYGLNTGYDVAPDGQRFLMVKSSSSTQQMPPNQLTFVVNWFEELKQRVPAK
jgi:dipeptidyl aminopeptidase/acylaminoacyl peptidase